MKKFAQLAFVAGMTVFAGTVAYASSSSSDKVAKVGETATQDVQKIIYACKENKNFQIVFINGEKNAYAVISQMDEVLPLEQTISASGAVFKAMDEGYNYELVTKGDKAFLNAGDQAIYEECTVANTTKLDK